MPAGLFICFRPDFATVLGGVFGAGTGPILLDNVGCTGTETRLEQCQHNGWGQYNCDHSEDVGVRCQPKATAPATPVVPTTTKAPTVVQDSNCESCFLQYLCILNMVN